MKIDAHQHFWEYVKDEYSWISDSMIGIRRDFLPVDFQKELLDLGFDGSIAVQARQTEQETEWLLSLSEQNDFILGVVGWVDLRDRNVNEVLAAYSRHSKFVGLRHVVHDEVDDSFMLQKDFLRGLSYLSELNLTYDFLLYPQHLPIAIEVARMLPEQRFVVDHIAKPLIKEKQMEPWATNIKELARLSNVYCKLSGMVTEANWEWWTPNDFFPYLDVVIDAFGTDRVMIGSDWPVCLLGGSYEEVMSIVYEYIDSFSKSEKAAILGSNCRNFYLGKKSADES